MLSLEELLSSVLDEDIEKIKSVQQFQDLGSWDSLTYVQLVVAVQSTFGFELSQDEIQNMTSYQGLEAILKSKDIQ